jgi:Ni/Fe-hydrogenase 1 B-type cytochrome subunit
MHGLRGSRRKGRGQILKTATPPTGSETGTPAKSVYVWELPVRLTHWINALCILVLTVTGFYIARPFVMPASESGIHIMGIARLVHFAFGFLFLASVIFRIYWLLAGNQWAHLKEFVPITFKRWKEIFACVRFYLFIDREPPRFTGHTALAACAYAGLFVMYILVIASGFALYSLERTGPIWTEVELAVFAQVGEQIVRLIHHAIMWLLIVFLIVHIYLSLLIDSTEKTSLISSIVTGYKSLPEEEDSTTDKH